MISGQGAQHSFHTHPGRDVLAKLWALVLSQVALTFLPPHWARAGQALGSTLILRSQMNV